MSAPLPWNDVDALLREREEQLGALRQELEAVGPRAESAAAQAREIDQPELALSRLRDAARWKERVLNAQRRVVRGQRAGASLARPPLRAWAYVRGLFLGRPRRP